MKILATVSEMRCSATIYIDYVQYTALLATTNSGMMYLCWHTKPRTENSGLWIIEANLTNVSCDTTYVKDLSYNDKHKMLFINYKGPAKEMENCWSDGPHETHDIDECITMSFSKNSYERLQKHLERLGFKK